HDRRRRVREPLLPTTGLQGEEPQAMEAGCGVTSAQVPRTTPIHELLCTCAKCRFWCVSGRELTQDDQHKVSRCIGPASRRRKLLTSGVPSRNNPLNDSDGVLLAGRRRGRCRPARGCEDLRLVSQSHGRCWLEFGALPCNPIATLRAASQVVPYC